MFCGETIRREFSALPETHQEPVLQNLKFPNHIKATAAHTTRWQGAAMSFAVEVEPLRCITAACAKVGGVRYCSVELVRSPKSYRLEVTGRTTRRRKTSVAQQLHQLKKGRKTSRDRSAEQLFAETWAPSDHSVDVPCNSSGAIEAPGPRWKRPRDCHDETATQNPRAEKRHNGHGGDRKGASRPVGSYGPKRLREAMESY